MPNVYNLPFPKITFALSSLSLTCTYNQNSSHGTIAVAKRRGRAYAVVLISSLNKTIIQQSSIITNQNKTIGNI